MVRRTSRRGFLAAAGAGAAVVALGACSDDDEGDATADTDPAGADTTAPAAGPGTTAAGAAAGTAVPALADAVVAHFVALGHEQRQPLPLVTGEAFNGGLRYDGSRATAEGQHDLVVQPCARVEDAGSADPTVLALFHQIDVRAGEGPRDPQEDLGVALDLLVDELGLDPSRLGVVSTELLAPAVPTLAARGVPDAQVALRPLDEAVAAGDGSGWFAPADHPDEDGLHTASLHYRVEDADGPLEYPTGPGWVELGELSVHAGPQAEWPVSVWGFGAERLELAVAGTTTSQAASTEALARAVAAEVDAGATPPPGLAAFGLA